MGTTDEDVETSPNTLTRGLSDTISGDVQEDVEVTVADSVETIEYDEENARYRVSYDPAADSTTLAVVGTVAAICRTDPTTLEPMYAVIDPSALDTLFSDAAETHSRRGLQVSFRFDRFDVTVRGGGVIELEETDDRRSTEL